MENKRRKKLIALLTGVSIIGSSYSACLIGQRFSIEKYYMVKMKNISISKNFYTYSDTLIDTNTKIPYPKEMVPQGLALCGDYYLISYYDSSYLNNSKIITINKNGDVINSVSLANKAHTGGICYDSENKWLWVSGEKGCIDIYDIEDIIKNEEATPLYNDIYVGDDLPNYKNLFENSVSYLTIFKGKLYVGSFSLLGEGMVKEYQIDKANLTLIREFSVPTKVQGLSFYSKNDNDYILFSRSYSNVPSLIQIFKYDESISDYFNNNDYVYYVAPAMLEQITLSEDNLYAIYESAADLYRKKNKIIHDEVCVSDCEKVINSRSFNNL